MNIFYTPHITPSDKQHELDNTESKHAIKVLRLKQGDQVTLVDGKGNFYTAEIAEESNKKCVVNILEVKAESQSAFHLHLAIAPTKNNDRMEWLVEKAVEIGISQISFVICDHSERNVIKTDRMKKRAISAMKQSLKARLPIINEATSFGNFVANNVMEIAYIAYCDEVNGKAHLKDCYSKGTDAVVLIGPEGDFSPKEVDMALKKGWKPVSLGEARLRTETAGLVACHTINLLNE